MPVEAAEFSWVSDLVRREAAIVLQPGKEYLVEARLVPLARAAGLAGPNEFVREARQAGNMAHRRAIVDALTTNETSWFRDAPVYQSFRKEILPRIVENKSAYQPLRVWSAATSTGQEAYSLAMLLTEELGSTNRFTIFGTDISRRVLEQAREGRYSQMELNRGLPARYMVQHFSRAGAGWQVNDDLKRRIEFREMNLAAPFPPGLPEFDVIFLRNVLIYFDSATKRDILRRIRRVLVPGGWLLLGTAETTRGLDDEFQLVRCGASSAYQAPGMPALQMSGKV